MPDTVPSQEIVPPIGPQTQNSPILETVGKAKDAGGSQEIKVFPAKRSSVRKHRLKPTQEAFIKHYTDPNSPAFGNGSEAYARAHPSCQSRPAAGVGSTRTLKSAKVQEVIAEHWGMDRLEAELERNLKACWDTQKLGDHREGLKVLAQLTGQWKERQEVTHMEDAQKDAIRREVSQALGSN